MRESTRQYVMRLVRRAGLMPLAENLRGRTLALGKGRANRRFRRAHAEVVFPPTRLMHDPYGLVDYAAYWQSGQAAAAALARIFAEYGGEAKGAVRILEWGCGPARILRHLPGLVPGGEFFGCDYNREAIAWCQENLPGLTFAPNDLAPPLDYPAASFDFIYCISVFTHLSEPMHEAWRAELLRVLKPGGCLVLSLHGDSFRRKLLPDELARFDAGALVVREGVSEGGRMFTAFHGERFVRERLLRSLDILRHEPVTNPACTPQDLWVVRKPVAP